MKRSATWASMWSPESSDVRVGMMGNGVSYPVFKRKAVWLHTKLMRPPHLLSRIGISVSLATPVSAQTAWSPSTYIDLTSVEKHRCRAHGRSLTCFSGPAMCNTSSFGAVLCTRGTLIYTNCVTVGNCYVEWKKYQVGQSSLSLALYVS